MAYPRKLVKCTCCGVAEIPDPIHIYDSTDGMCDDCSQLVRAAIKAISTARQIGVPRYGPSSWKESTIDKNIDHATAHIYLWRRGDTSEDQLAHAICRLVMAKEIIDNGEISRRETTRSGGESSSTGEPSKV